jgi:hypothetical protein
MNCSHSVLSRSLWVISTGMALALVSLGVTAATADVVIPWSLYDPVIPNYTKSLNGAMDWRLADDTDDAQASSESTPENAAETDAAPQDDSYAGEPQPDVTVSAEEEYYRSLETKGFEGTEATEQPQASADAAADQPTPAPAETTPESFNQYYKYKYGMMHGYYGADMGKRVEEKADETKTDTNKTAPTPSTGNESPATDAQSSNPPSDNPSDYYKYKMQYLRGYYNTYSAENPAGESTGDYTQGTSQGAYGSEANPASEEAVKENTTDTTDAAATDSESDEWDEATAPMSDDEADSEATSPRTTILSVMVGWIGHSASTVNLLGSLLTRGIASFN